MFRYAHLYTLTSKTRRHWSIYRILVICSHDWVWTLQGSPYSVSLFQTVSEMTCKETNFTMVNEMTLFEDLLY